jgi:hypothetical protein
MGTSKIILYNEPDTPEKRFLLIAATRFFLSKLLPIKQKRITIHLYCDEPLIDAEAETCWVDKNKLPNEFEIKFSSKIKSYRRIIQTLAHEMIHIKQFAKGEMYDHLHAPKVRWRNKNYNVEEIDYWDYPWEIEAYGKELGLYVKFLSEFDLSNNDINKNYHIAMKKIMDKHEKDLHKSGK